MQRKFVIGSLPNLYGVRAILRELGLPTLRGIDCQARGGVPVSRHSPWQCALLMPYSFEFAAPQRMFRSRFDGHVSADDVRQFIEFATTFADDRGGSIVGIVDFSDVKNFELSPPDIHELASRPPVIRDREALRFIIAPSPFIYGLARMFELLGQETRPNLHVVRSQKEVWVILGIEEPKFEPVALPDESADATGA